MPEAQPKLLGMFDDWLVRRERTFEAWITSKRTGRPSCYKAYSILFVPFALLVLAGLLLELRELIWYVDGLNQYYPFFVREGALIREIVGGLLSGQGLNIPMWEWNSGYGADVLVTFDVFLDPLNLVSAITPPALSEWVFQLLVVLRFYLAGLAFTFYCRTRGENHAGTVLGALLYSLSGAALMAVKWTSGIHALILFPLVLAGAERILADRRPWVFVASFATLAFVSYFFTYMAGILLVGYLAVRVCMVEGERLTPKRFLMWVVRFFGLVVLCLMLAGIVLVPSVMALLQMGRVTDAKAAVPIVYSFDYYLRMLGDFLSIHEVGSDTYQGFGGVAFLACLAFFSRPGNKVLKRALVVLFVLMCVPAFGSLMNGLNYATNRWAWAYALCMALVLTRATPALLRPDARLRGVLVVGTVAYGLLFVIYAFRIEANVAGFAALVVALLVLLVTQGFAARRSVLVLALGLTMCVVGFYMLSKDEGGIGKMQDPAGTSYAMLTSRSANTLARETGDESWWRYDAGQSSINAPTPIYRIRNDSLVLGVRGIDFYNSVYNNGVDAFHTELAVAGDEVNFAYQNLQGRSDLLSLVGVKYYLYRGDGTDALPHGFSEGDVVVERGVADVPYRLHVSRDSLSVGTGHTRVLTSGDYAALSPVERQQALLQAVVLDEKDATGVSAVRADVGGLAFESEDVTSEVASANGVVCEPGRFVVERAGATVTLGTHGKARADTLLYVRGLSYRGIGPSGAHSEEELAAMPWYSRAKMLVEDLSYVEPSHYEIMMSTDVSAKCGYVTNYTPKSHMYGGKDTWLVDLGYADEPAQSVTITFDVPGIYTYESLQVQTQTYDLHPAWLEERRSAMLEEVVQGCNHLSGTIKADEPQILLLTIPYSEGWSAQVDGEPAKLMRADTAFMAIDLPAGEHRIELHYMTPGLVQGAIVSAAGVACLAVLAVVLRWRDRTRDRC